DNPFPEKPPRFVRAVLYRYSFAKPGNPEGHFWNRERISDEWIPAMSVKDPRLTEFLKGYGWLH
ncbi:MAG TPA: lipase maturation factor family protein, partial [Puia sp.]|nr:lipase maturation factor family protein [Puia sp.]